MDRSEGDIGSQGCAQPSANKRWKAQTLYHGVGVFSAGSLAGPYEGLEAEECGILDGCAHGRCVRVPEGFTCDCFDGYRLDMTRMACVGERAGRGQFARGDRVEALFRAECSGTSRGRASPEGAGGNSCTEMGLA